MFLVSNIVWGLGFAGWPAGRMVLKTNALAGALIRGNGHWQAHNQCALVGMDHE